MYWKAYWFFNLLINQYISHILFTVYTKFLLLISNFKMCNKFLINILPNLYISILNAGILNLCIMCGII